MTGTAPWQRLHVFGAGAGAGDAGGRWRVVVDAASALAGLLPSYEEAATAGRADRASVVLAHAGATGDPVLVLPEHAEERGGPDHGRRLQLMVPTDFTRDEERVLRRWADRASHLGFDVHQLHVLDASTRPAMWEGTGHHAAAWWDEQRRRHQLRHAHLSVRSGDTVERILERSTGVDLVLVYWRGGPASGHALVVRQLLERGRLPLLLVRDAPLAHLDPGGRARVLVP